MIRRPLRPLAPLLLLCACVAPPPDGGAGGLHVAAAAALLRGAATDVETWDLNGDGVLDGAERAGMFSAIAARFAAAILVGR